MRLLYHYSGIVFRIFFFLPLFALGQGDGGDSKPITSIQVKKTTDFQFKGDGQATEWNQTDWVVLNAHTANPLGYQTMLKILYSEKGIYCLFHSTDKKITATLRADFLDIYNEDVVEAFFWTDESFPVYFEYELSPLNFELPIMVPNHQGDFFGWRPWHYEGDRLTRHATFIEKDPSNSELILSWRAEFFIPYTLLKPLPNVPPQKGTRWRANFYRMDYDKERVGWAWQPIRKNYHDYQLFGTLNFE